MSDGWLPIKDAPKNTPVIIGRLRAWSSPAIWQDRGHKVGWFVYGAEWEERLQSATHWMPLPAPPAKEQTA